jgi:hypothetical protein
MARSDQERQFVAAARQPSKERGRLSAAPYRRQIIVRSAEIDRKTGRIDAGESRSLGRSRERDDGHPVDPVDA